MDMERRIASLDDPAYLTKKNNVNNPHSGSDVLKRFDLSAFLIPFYNQNRTSQDKMHLNSHPNVPHHFHSEREAGCSGESKWSWILLLFCIILIELDQ